jgi:hypothetical protein
VPQPSHENVGATKVTQPLIAPPVEIPDQIIPIIPRPTHRHIPRGQQPLTHDKGPRFDFAATRSSRATSDPSRIFMILMPVCVAMGVLWNSPGFDCFPPSNAISKVF